MKPAVAGGNGLLVAEQDLPTDCATSSPTSLSGCSGTRAEYSVSQFRERRQSLTRRAGAANLRRLPLAHGCMRAPSYDLPIPSESLRRTTRAWLLLALASLVGAGVYSLLLVLARTPT